MRIGFIGLGTMGAAIARNLAAAGYAVQAWNRSPYDAIAGVDSVGSAAEAAAADVVFSMLSDDAAIRAVMLDSGLLETMPQGAIHVSMATISVAFADELAGRHRAAGLSYVSAPVFGRPDVAAAGQLNVIAAGPSAALETLRPLFAAIGRRTWELGETASAANAVKIGGNMMIAMAIEAMAEGSALAGHHGVDAGTFLGIMTETLFAARAYQSYAPNIIASDYAPAFKMTLGLKDLRLALAASEGAGDQPMLHAVHDRMAAAVGAGLGDRDWSAIAAFRPDD